MSGVSRYRVQRVGVGPVRATSDEVAVEEPLEVRVEGLPPFVTMRTPGHDTDLVLGWLVSQGAIGDPRDVVRVSERSSGEGARRAASVTVRLATGVAPPPPRRYPATSACGVCGADAAEFVAERAPRVDAGAGVDPALIASLPDRMRDRQRAFARSGGLHAAGLFDLTDGRTLVVREDVGRHNAVDKVVGWALRGGRVPASGCALTVSGRASFELVEKAALAGIPVLAAVSAPSSLAVELARSVGLTLAAFVRDGSFTVYAGEQRLRPPVDRG